jgi:hypothetical protein
LHLQFVELHLELLFCFSLQFRHEFILERLLYLG